MGSSVDTRLGRKLSTPRVENEKIKLMPASGTQRMISIHEMSTDLGAVLFHHLSAGALSRLTCPSALASLSVKSEGSLYIVHLYRLFTAPPSLTKNKVLC